MLKSSFVDFFIECFTFVVVFLQSPSHIRSSRIFATPQTAARQDSLSFTVSRILLKLMSIESVILSSHFILCCPLLLRSIFPSIRVFSDQLALCIRWPKYSASASVLPMNIQDLFPLGLTGLISLLVQGTAKSLLQHQNSKTSILQWLAFFMVQLSHPCMTTEKNIVLTRWTFVGKVLSLVFNMLSRFV